MHETLQPSHWKPPLGYANAVLAAGRTVYLGGQVGWNPEQVFETDDFVGQVEQTLRNIVEILKEADAGPEHLVRLTWFVPDKREYQVRLGEVGQAYRRVIGRHFPAMSLVEVRSLLEEGAKVEIEATAVVP